MTAQRFVLLIAAVAATACTTVRTLMHPNSVTPAEIGPISDSVRATVVQFTEATARLDAPRVLSLIAGDSAFEAVLGDTVISGQAAFADLVRTSFPALHALEPHVDTVRVAVLTRASAVARVVFRQSSAGDGGAEDHGVITYGLARRKEGWRIVYEHVTTSR